MCFFGTHIPNNYLVFRTGDNETCLQNITGGWVIDGRLRVRDREQKTDRIYGHGAKTVPILRGDNSDT